MDELTDQRCPRDGSIASPEDVLEGMPSRGLPAPEGARTGPPDRDLGSSLLAERLREPELDGEARFLPDSGNTGAIELPIRFTPVGDGHRPSG